MLPEVKSVKEYIDENLLISGYGTYVKDLSLEDLLMLKFLCEYEINKIKNEYT